MNRASLTLLILLGSGCLGGQTEVDSVSEAHPLEFPSIDGILQAGGCKGFQIEQVYPLGTNPAAPPAGWHSDSEYSAIWLLVWECKNVGLDAIERPATVAWEVSTGAAPPEDCMEADYGVTRFVVNTFTDDAELADVLRGRYGLETHIAEFQQEVDGLRTTATWSIDGSTSSMEFVSEAPEDARFEEYGRLVWETSQGPAFMTFNTTSVQNPLNYRFGEGTLQSPHILGVENTFVGPARLDHDGSILGHIQFKSEVCP